jgi:competence protein ComEC
VSQPTGSDGPALREPRPDLRLLPAAVTAWAVSWWACAGTAHLVLLLAGVLTVGVIACVGVLAFGGRSWSGDVGRAGRVGRGGWGGRGRSGARVPRVDGIRLAATLLVPLVSAAVLLATTGLRLLDRERDPLTRAAGAGLAVSVQGRVTGDPHRVASGAGAARGERWVVTLAAGRLKVRGRWGPASGGLVVLGSAAWSTPVAGARVQVSGRLVPTEAGDPASALVFPRSSPVVLDAGSWPWRVADRLRRGLRTACDDLPPAARGLLPALVVGDTSRLDPGLTDDLRGAGLTHLTAVSGANLAILAAVVVSVVGGLGGGRRRQVAASVPVIAGFVVLARPEPSVLRAAVMGSLALIGLLQARRGAGLPLLAVTTVVLLGIDPWLARGFGFVLSVLATAGLLLLVPAWVRRVRRLPAAVVTALAVPVAAQVMTAPVTVLLNPTLSLVSVPANLLVSAAVAPATLAGVAAAALSPLWPGGARLLATLGGWATLWIALVAHIASGLPGASVPWPGGLGGAAAMASIAAGAVGLSLRGVRTAPASGPVRAGAVPVIALLVTAVLVTVVLSAPRWLPAIVPGRGGAPPDWAVIQCDVGQGSATLLRSGPDRAVVVDTGPDPAAVDRCLRRARVRILDLVVITHFHADHAGGLRGALHGRGHPPILVSPLAEPDDEVRAVNTTAGEVGARVVTVTATISGTAGSGPWTVPWVLLSPSVPTVGSGSAHAIGSAAGSRGSDPAGTVVNNASVVLFAQLQGLRVALLGDVEPEAQRPLVRRIEAGEAGPAALGADVVVVAHHGSARQEPRLYRLLRPRVALFGVGAGNDYGHPAPSALALVRAVGAVGVRTDRRGQIAVCGPAGRLRVVTSK